MSEQKKKSSLGELQRRHRMPFDATAMLIYLLIVHVWGLWVYPLGRDYAILADPKASLTPVGAWFLQLEQQVFGTHVSLYHAVNLVFLYACMILVYFLTNRILKGPRWFGTLAATLFMANPVHAEAALNLCGGAADLLPAVSALAALLAYVWYSERASGPRGIVGLAVFASAVFAFPQNVPLVLVFALFAVLMKQGGSRRWAMIGACAVAAAVSGYLHAAALSADISGPMPFLLSLYTVAYPLGLLPETVHRFLERPWLFWLSVVIALGLVVAVYRKMRRRQLLFGLAGMFVASLCSFARPVDPYHLIGGGQLIVATALFNLALCTVFCHMNAHPKWNRPVVAATTILCFVLFGMKISAVSYWNASSTYVQEFQERAATEAGAGPLGILPDYRYYFGAPMCLSDAIAYDTPFSRRVDYEVLLPLNYDAPPAMVVSVSRSGSDEATVHIVGKNAVEVVPFPYTLANPGGEIRTKAARVTRVENEQPGFTLQVRALEGVLPQALLPGATSPLGEESGE